MRKLVFLILAAALTALVAVRALLPEQTSAVMSPAADYGYNILDIDLPVVEETAGSAMIAEMNGYFLFRTPTEKSALTGALRGMNLVLICADGWKVDGNSLKTGALRRLAAGGADISAVYRPDWYLGSDGRQFALLSGLVPTNVNGVSSFVYAGRQDIYLPYALARALAGEGYACRAYTRAAGQADAYAALGFDETVECAGPAREILEEAMDARGSEQPFFDYYVFEDGELSEALEYLMDALPKKTAVCLLTQGESDMRARLFLYGYGLAGAASDAPCSELDVTPTLLNLLGVDFDSRFLSGRDIFAPNAEPGLAGDATPAVSLYGSAHSDWVTDMGSYTAADGLFRQTGDALHGSAAVAAYVRGVSLLVYDRYIFARKVMENNYFHLMPGP